MSYRRKKKISKVEPLNYLLLSEAAKYCHYSQEYLSLRARQGCLQAVKIGRNWMTTRDWIRDYEEKTRLEKLKEGLAPPDIPPAILQTSGRAEGIKVPETKTGFWDFVFIGAGEIKKAVVERSKIGLANLKELVRDTYINITSWLILTQKACFELLTFIKVSIKEENLKLNYKLISFGLAVILGSFGILEFVKPETQAKIGEGASRGVNIAIALSQVVADKTSGAILNAKDFAFECGVRFFDSAPRRGFAQNDKASDFLFCDKTVVRRAITEQVKQGILTFQNFMDSVPDRSTQVGLASLAVLDELPSTPQNIFSETKLAANSVFEKTKNHSRNLAAALSIKTQEKVLEILATIDDLKNFSELSFSENKKDLGVFAEKVRENFSIQSFDSLARSLKTNPLEKLEALLASAGEKAKSLPASLFQREEKRVEFADKNNSPRPSLNLREGAAAAFSNIRNLSASIQDQILGLQDSFQNTILSLSRTAQSFSKNLGFLLDNTNQKISGLLFGQTPTQNTSLLIIRKTPLSQQSEKQITKSTAVTPSSSAQTSQRIVEISRVTETIKIVDFQKDLSALEAKLALQISDLRTSLNQNVFSLSQSISSLPGQSGSITYFVGSTNPVPIQYFSSLSDMEFTGLINQTASDQVTFNGNVDANSGIDIRAGSLTVGGSAFTVDQSGNLTMSGNFSASGTNNFGNGYFNGSLGVGTSSPMAQLAVVSSSATMPSFVIQGTSTQTSPYLTVYDSNGNEKLNLDSSGNLTISGNSTTTGQAVISYSPTSAGEDNTKDSALYVYAATPAPDANLITAANDGNWKFRVDAEGDVFIRGNLTTDGVVQQATTEVTGNLMVEGYSNLGDAPNNDYLVVSGYTRIFATTTTPTLSVYQGSTGNIFSAFDNDTQVFTIADGGYVGIGTSSPLTKLSVQGTVGANDVFNISSSTGASMLYVNALGNVGIGTAAPLAQLQVVGNEGLVVMDNELSQYWGFQVISNGDLRFNNNGVTSGTQIVFDNSGNVGIGTTTPSQKMEIYGTGSQALRITSSDDNDASLEMLRTGDAYIDWRIRNSGGTMYFDQSANDGSTWTSPFQISYGEYGIPIATSNAVLGGRNYGLLINPTSASSAARFGFWAGTNANRVIMGESGSNTGDFAVYSSTNSGSTWINTMIVANTGLVGIGTCSPYAQLSISNTASTAANGTLFAIASTTAGVSTTTLMTVLANGNVGIGTAGPSGKLNVIGASSIGGLNGTMANAWMSVGTVSAGIHMDSNELHLVGDDFNIYADTDTKDIRLSVNSGLALIIKDGGNVGIGTTSPLTKLSIQGTAGANDVLNISSSTGASMVYVNAAGNVGIGTTSPYAKLSVQSLGGSSAPLFIVASSTNGAATSTAMIVDAFGNVGIGTASPTAKLQVTGNIIASYQATDVDAAANIYMVGNENRQAGLYMYADEGDDNADKWRLYLDATNIFSIDDLSSGSWDKNLAITTTGNVGIGTTSPYAKLSIHANNGETNTTLFSIASSTASATSTLFTILNNGNVGIGTTSPLTKLSVQGTV
ncbi:MAG: hypothetical protein WC620_11665, partial [Methanoregula sp.]